MVGSVFRATRGIAVSKRTDGASWMAGKDGGNAQFDSEAKAKLAAENTKLAIADHKASFDIESPNEAPLLICPEGSTHSGGLVLQSLPRHSECEPAGLS